MKRLFGVLAIVALSLAAKPAVAHHALQAEFDTAKRGEFTGTLTKFAMINPHVRWFFDVKKADGTVDKWEITGAGPQALRANGMTRIFSVGPYATKDTRASAFAAQMKSLREMPSTEWVENRVTQRLYETARSGWWSSVLQIQARAFTNAIVS